MKIALPLLDGKLLSHVGHCERFAIIDVDLPARTIVSNEEIVPPTREPGFYPSWLATLGVTYIIAGGMDEKTVNLFIQNHIEVVAGRPGEVPEKIMKLFLRNAHVRSNTIYSH